MPLPYKEKIRHPIYNVWNGMWDRCRNPNNNRYHLYGARGISVCKRWKSFETFVDDMGPRPIGYQIDRINNNRGYSPSNCRWATRREQANNKRNNHLVRYKGVSKTLAEWGDEIAIGAHLLKVRLQRGWPVKKAFETPPDYRFLPKKLIATHDGSGE